jgi:hypothetical protein
MRVSKLNGVYLTKNGTLNNFFPKIYYFFRFILIFGAFLVFYFYFICSLLLILDRIFMMVIFR